MSEPRSDTWQAWQMGPLERRAQSERQTEQALPARRAAPPDCTPLRRRGDAVAARLIAQAHEQAVQRGRAEGHAAGYAEGYAEAERRVQIEHAERLDRALAEALAPAESLVEALAEATRALDTRVAEHLTELALEIGRQLAGRALALAPEHVIDDIQGLIDAHPGLTGQPILYVSGPDQHRVERYLGNALAAAGWRVSVDVALQPGDCRIEDDEREISHLAAERWQRLLQTVGHEEHR